MRYNTVKGINNNLNSKGMLFTQNSKISPSELLLSKLATIAVAYEKQLVEEVIHDTFDQKINYILTEKDLYKV